MRFIFRYDASLRYVTAFILFLELFETRDGLKRASARHQDVAFHISNTLLGSSKDAVFVPVFWITCAM